MASGRKYLSTRQRKARSLRLLNRQFGQCYWCGCRLVRVQDVPRELVVAKRATFIAWREADGGTTQALLSTLDHVIPRSRGGSNDDENVVASCAFCNQDRADTGRPQLPAPTLTDPEPGSVVLWSSRSDT